jgi:hypothetical protein
MAPLPMCPASMGPAIETGTHLWMGTGLFLFGLALSFWGTWRAVLLARRGRTSIAAALAAALVAGAHVGLFLALLPVRSPSNFQLTERLAILILFVAVSGLPMAWFLAATHPFWQRRRR